MYQFATDSKSMPGVLITHHGGFQAIKNKFLEVRLIDIQNGQSNIICLTTLSFFLLPAPLVMSWFPGGYNSVQSGTKKHNSALIFKLNANVLINKTLF